MIMPLHESSLILIERRAQASVLVGERLYYWGGIVLISERLPEDSSSEDSEDSDEDASLSTVPGIPANVLRVRKNLPHTPKNLIDVYDIKQKLWFQFSTVGNVPPPDYGAAMCELNGFIYLFGGYNDLHFSSSLYQLDITSMTWQKMKVHDIAPSPVYRTSLVPHKKRNCLVSFGGACERIPRERLQLAGAEYNEYGTSPHPYGCNNEYHEYSVTEGTWSRPGKVTGRPGPRSSHAVTAIDSHRAVMFGGICGEISSDELYVLDMETQIFHRIHKPVSSGNPPWPLPRCLHPICSLTALDESSEGVEVFVMCGRDTFYYSTETMVADDTGVLTFNKDLTEAKYRQFLLPLVPRYWHTANSYHVKGSKEVFVFVFGGNVPLVQTERFGLVPRSEKTGLRLWRGDFRVLQWGSNFPALRSLCLDAISANFSLLSPLLLPLRGSVVLADLLEHHRKGSYYKPIRIQANCDPGDGGSSSTQFMFGVGYGRAIPNPR